MEPWLKNILIGAIVGAVIGGGIGIVMALMPKRKCPDCGQPMAKARTASGGWSCARCGCVLDREGRKIEQ